MLAINKSAGNSRIQECCRFTSTLSGIGRQLCSAIRPRHSLRDVVPWHESVKNTWIYIQLGEAIFKEQDDEFICKVDKTVDEAKVLIEDWFDYVCEFDSVKLITKPSSGKWARFILK